MSSRLAYLGETTVSIFTWARCLFLRNIGWIFPRIQFYVGVALVKKHKMRCFRTHKWLKTKPPFRRRCVVINWVLKWSFRAVINLWSKCSQHSQDIWFETEIRFWNSTILYCCFNDCCFPFAAHCLFFSRRFVDFRREERWDVIISNTQLLDLKSLMVICDIRTWVNFTYTFV